MMEELGLFQPRIFQYFVAVPGGISALCLGTANCFPVIGLYQMSCRLPFRINSHLPLFSFFNNSGVFIVPPFYEIIITRIDTCVNENKYKYVLNIFIFDKFFPVLIVARAFQIIMTTVNRYSSTFAGYKIMSMFTFNYISAFFATNFISN